MSLDNYNEKRDFNKTNEPIGRKEKSCKKLRFVVQHHIASHDHYDLRLECDGVLLSFAIPKGPSFNPSDKRLAVNVEDHPLSYRNFEGVIPDGEYGAGTVMLWDYGYYDSSDINKEYRNGSIKFTLYGERLKGGWSLIKFKDNNWLLIKERDGFALKKAGISKYNRSIKTNRTMREIRDNKKSNGKNIICGIEITHPEKVIFTNPKVTKLDIAKYYHKVSSKMLPLIENRIFSTIRMPDKGDKFFMKHFPNNPYLGKKLVTNSKGEREYYYYIKNEKGLIYEVQNNSYEFHIWGSDIHSINNPDVMVLDLDPDKDVSLKDLRLLVKKIRLLLQKFKLKAFVKTSGGKGYHIVVPINFKISWEKLRDISKKMAVILEEENPSKYTSNIRLSKRKGKIFIDWQRNIKGSTFVAPYSLRLKDKPSISMPITWTSLDKILPDGIKITDIKY